MIPKTVVEYLKGVEPLSPLAETYIMVRGTVTGSHVFGGMKEGSDIDYLLPPNIGKKLFETNLCYEPGEYNEAEFQSFYVKTTAGSVFNLLFMNSQDNFDKWKYATDRMNEFRSSLFADKEIRVAAFEKYKEEWENNNGQ